jgi:hypothetical protein
VHVAAVQGLPARQPLGDRGLLDDAR